MLIERTGDGAHWYGLEDGVVVPRNVCQSADGKKEINVTLRQARPKGLLPSVTSVLMEMKSLALEKWKISMAVQAALTIDRLPEEGMDEFIERSMGDFTAVSDGYKEYGRRAHSICERIAKEGRLLSTDPDLEHIAVMFWDWLQGNTVDVLAVEEMTAAYGYAGCVDLVVQLKDGPVAIVDLKTQRPKQGKPFVAWESYAPQLVAYGDALAVSRGDIRFRHAKRMNILISSDPDIHRLEVIEHSATETNRAKFLNCFLTWCLARNYFPPGFDSQYVLGCLHTAMVARTE